MRYYMAYLGLLHLVQTSAENVHTYTNGKTLSWRNPTKADATCSVTCERYGETALPQNECKHEVLHPGGVCYSFWNARGPGTDCALINSANPENTQDYYPYGLWNGFAQGADGKSEASYQLSLSNYPYGCYQGGFYYGFGITNGGGGSDAELINNEFWCVCEVQPVQTSEATWETTCNDAVVTGDCIELPESGDYSSNQDCTITSTKDGYLTFEEFNVERARFYDSAINFYDYLEIDTIRYYGDGTNTDIYKSNVPPSMSITTTTPFRFVSDTSDQYTGFKMCVCPPGFRGEDCATVDVSGMDAVEDKLAAFRAAKEDKKAMRESIRSYIRDKSVDVQSMKANKFEVEADDLSDRLKGKLFGKTPYIMVAPLANSQSTDCHLDVSQEGNERHIVYPYMIFSYAYMCDGDTFIARQRQTSSGYETQCYDNGWETAITSTSDGETTGITCGKYKVGIGSLNNDCEGASCGGCTDTTACNYDASATFNYGTCTYVDELCDTCVNGIVIDNDADDDGLCDADESGDSEGGDECVVPICICATASQYINAQCCTCS